MEGRFASAIGFLGLESGLRLVRMPRTPGSERDDPDQRETRRTLSAPVACDGSVFQNTSPPGGFEGLNDRRVFGLDLEDVEADGVGSVGEFPLPGV